MRIPSFFSRRWSKALVALGVFLAVGGTALALYPNSFWRILDRALQNGTDNRLSILHGNETSPTEHIAVTTDGRVGVGTFNPATSSLLDLRSDHRALLVTRHLELKAVENPVDGMIIYDQTAAASAGDNCFRVRQNAAWSDCYGQKYRIQVVGGIPQSGMIGDVIFEAGSLTLYIHDGTQFVPLFRTSVGTGDTFPINNARGDLFYRTDLGQLFLFTDPDFVPIPDFTRLVSYQRNCTRHEVTSGDRELQCPNNKKVASIFYQEETFTTVDDNLQTPEIEAIECCETALWTHYWDIDCSTDPGTIVCRDVSGVSQANEGFCIALDRPTITTECDGSGGGGGGGNGDDCFGDSIVTALTSPHSGTGRPENVLGAPDGQVVQFDNVGASRGHVTVKMGEPITDQAGNDLRIHLVDFVTTEPMEAFEVRVSQTGISGSFISIGKRSPRQNTPHARSHEDFDIGVSGLSQIQYVSILNETVDDGQVEEGPDIDAIRSIHCDAGGDPDPDPQASCQTILTGAGFAGGPHIKTFATGQGPNHVESFMAYHQDFRGGAYVAYGDINGDGEQDIITGAGAGGGPHVKVFDGTNLQNVLHSFMAYSDSFAGGVTVATGDINGDGRDDIITGAGSGGGPHVKVFDGVTGDQIESFMAYDRAFAGGVTVASGDINGDGRDDVITGAGSPALSREVGSGAGGGPHVKVFDGTNVDTVLESFMAYSVEFVGGVNVGSGDINGDGRDDIITGAGPTGGPHVRVFDGTDVSQTLHSFMAYNTDFTGGVNVAAADLNHDGKDDIITGAGPSGGPHVRAFDGATGDQIESFMSYAVEFGGGVHVAGKECLTE